MMRERPPCFVCEQREAEPGQILCMTCLEWSEADSRTVAESRAKDIHLADRRTHDNL